MRLSLPFALLPCIVSHAYAVPAKAISRSTESERSVDTNVAFSEPAQTFREVDVQCQEDDEAFSFSFDLLEPNEDDTCEGSNRSSLLFNGQQLVKGFSASGREWRYLSTLEFTSENSLNHEIRELELSSSVTCVQGNSSGSDQRSQALEDPDDVETTSLKVENIDGRPSQSNCGLTLSFNRKSRQIIGLWPAPDANEVPLNSQPEPSRAPAHDDHEAAEPSIDDEIRRLRYLEDHLSELKRVVGDQKDFVHGLAKQKVIGAKQELKQCRDVTCVLKTFLRKLKGSVHIIYLRFGPHEPSRGFDHFPGTPHWPDMRPASAHCSVSGEDPKGSCSPPLHSSHNGGHSSCFGHSNRASDILYTSMILVASLLCIGCIFTICHYRCCNPRARADRAARREERRTRRQYRYLARRKEWRDWWNQRVRRNHAPSSSDYEEKRSLIVAQEAVLESAMQNEIIRLQRAHGADGDMVSAAEEGRSSTSRTESRPPSYRSRTSSGRPPSYHEVDNDGGRGRVGVARYTPSAAGDTPEGTDFTPDSSVAGVSPRNSFETLRTELSVV